MQVLSNISTTRMAKGRATVKADWFEVPHIGYWLVIVPALGYMEVGPYYACLVISYIVV